MRQDQWLISVTLDGEDLGTWDTMGGGAVTATETKYRPGGMEPEVSLGGQTSVDNVTLGRLLSTKDDWDTMRALMAAKVGRSTVGVSRQPLDVDGNAWGDPLSYTGKLQQVVPGDTDSNGTGASVWQIVVSTAGGIG
jgi:hypothetical protein